MLFFLINYYDTYIYIYLYIRKVILPMTNEIKVHNVRSKYPIIILLTMLCLIVHNIIY